MLTETLGGLVWPALTLSGAGAPGSGEGGLLWQQRQGRSRTQGRSWTHGCLQGPCSEILLVRGAGSTALSASTSPPPNPLPQDAVLEQFCPVSRTLCDDGGTALYPSVSRHQPRVARDVVHATAEQMFHLTSLK